MSMCKFCGLVIEWKRRGDGKMSCFEPGTDTFHYCLEIGEYEQKRKEGTSLKILELQRKSICQFYINHNLPIPDQYQTFDKVKEYEQWAESEPPKKIPADIINEAKQLGVGSTFIEEIPF